MERVLIIEKIFTLISVIGLVMVGFVSIYLAIENFLLGDMISYSLIIPYFLIGFFGLVIPGFIVSFILHIKYSSPKNENNSD